MENINRRLIKIFQECDKLSLSEVSNWYLSEDKRESSSSSTRDAPSLLEDVREYDFQSVEEYLGNCPYLCRDVNSYYYLNTLVPKESEWIDALLTQMNSASNRYGFNDQNQ